MMGHTLPGGYPMAHAWPSTLFCSEPVPQEYIAQVGVADGACKYEVPAILGADGPTYSPPLYFEATDEALWTFNVGDLTLYHRTDWSDVRLLEMDQANPTAVRWRLYGVFMDGEFMTLRVEPRAGAGQAFLRLLKSKGVRITLEAPPAASN